MVLSGRCVSCVLLDREDFVFASLAHLLIYIFPIDPIFSGQGQAHWRAGGTEKALPRI